MNAKDRREKVVSSQEYEGNQRTDVSVERSVAEGRD